MRWVPLCLLPAVTYKHCLSSKKQIKWEMWGNTTKLYMTAVTYKYCLSSKKQTKCADEETQQNYVWWKKTNKLEMWRKGTTPQDNGQWNLGNAHCSDSVLSNWIGVPHMLNCKINSTNGGTFSNFEGKILVRFFLVHRAIIMSK